MINLKAQRALDLPLEAWAFGLLRWPRAHRGLNPLRDFSAIRGHFPQIRTIISGRAIPFPKADVQAVRIPQRIVVWSAI